MKRRNKATDFRQTMPVTRFRNSQTVSLAVQILYVEDGGVSNQLRSESHIGLELGPVLQDGIEYSCSQDQLTSDHPFIDLILRQAVRLSIVGPENQDEMNQHHANGERDDAEHDNLVLGKEALDSYIATT